MNTREPPTPALLITGITGVAGFRALHHFRRHYPGPVVGIRPRKTWQLTGPDVAALDAEDHDGLARLFEAHRFGAVLNCAGNCALKSCELDPAMARVVNVETAANLARTARAFEARLVHLSTDLVFSGDGAGGYTEADPVDPVTVYGKTMAEGEGEVFAHHPGAAILRISLPMGRSFSGHAGVIDWIRSRFAADRPATLYFDEVRSCADAAELCEVFAWFLSHEVAGLYHVPGPRALSLYQIGQIINRAGGYPPELLRGIPRARADPVPPRAGNVSLNGDKLAGLAGVPRVGPWPARDDLVSTDGRWHERRGAEVGVEGLYR